MKRLVAKKIFWQFYLLFFKMLLKEAVSVSFSFAPPQDEGEAKEAGDDEDGSNDDEEDEEGEEDDEVCDCCLCLSTLLDCLRCWSGMAFCI